MFLSENNTMKEICRICLCSLENIPFVDIFSEVDGDKTVDTLISTVAPVKVWKSEEMLPQKVCHVCIKKLKASFRFREQIIQSDLKLRGKLDDLFFSYATDGNVDTKCKSSNVKLEADEFDEPNYHDNTVSDNSDTKFNCKPVVFDAVQNTNVQNCNSDDSNQKSGPTGKQGKKYVKKSFTCAECNKTFRSKHLLEWHIQMHMGVMRFLCEICKKGFVKRWQLNLHKRVHTGERPYPCDVCGKSFRFISNLNTHKRLHNGSKPFACGTCGKTFTQVAGLKAHERTHTGEKPFVCEICSRTFSERSTLQTHFKLHSGVKTIPCLVCGKMFTLPRSLKTHMRTHTGEKPYSCTICEKKFTASGSLKSHMRIHDGIKPYSCKICGKRFTQANCVVRHMRIHQF